MQSQMHYKRQEINVNILEKYLTDRFTIKQVKKYIYGYGQEYNFSSFYCFLLHILRPLQELSIFLPRLVRGKWFQYHPLL